ncbi:MAG: hypothetical protein LLG04_12985 [Parachlamydia sp.]|nr:hypothetical protein [Parachlamydia sp.]
MDVSGPNPLQNSSPLSAESPSPTAPITKIPLSTVSSTNKVFHDFEKNLPKQQARMKILEQIWELDDKIREIRLPIEFAKLDLEYNPKSQKARNILLEKEKERDTLRQQVNNLTHELDQLDQTAEVDLENPKKVRPDIKDISSQNLLDTTKEAFSEQRKLPMVTVVVSDASDATKTLQGLLQNHPGLCIGERHDTTASTFIQSHLPFFRSMGVTTLFLEGLDYKNQYLFDDFHQSGDTKFLEQGIRSVIIEEKIKLFQVARQEGIRIVAIDSKSSMEFLGTHRILSMNYLANEIITLEKGKGKFVALVGATHLTSIYKGAFPGLAEMTRCPAIEMFGSEDLLTQHHNIMKSLFHSMRTEPHMTLIKDLHGRVQVMTEKA